MKIAIYGGAFDPFHNGHAHVVKAVAALGYPVLVAPTYKHPWGKETAPFADRLAIASLACSDIPGVEISNCELFNESGTTVETLSVLRNRYPDGEFALVVGETDALEIENWTCGKKLIKENSFIVIPRHPALTPPDAWYKKGSNIYLEDLQKVVISSTQWKALLETDPIEASLWLDPYVTSYIISQDLYNTENPNRR